MAPKQKRRFCEPILNWEVPSGFSEVVNLHDNAVNKLQKSSVFCSLQRCTDLILKPPALVEGIRFKRSRLGRTTKTSSETQLWHHSSVFLPSLCSQSPSSSSGLSFSQALCPGSSATTLLTECFHLSLHQMSVSLSWSSREWIRLAFGPS